MFANKPSDWANIIQERRRTLGMTQADLAEAIGASRQWVSLFESGSGAASARLGVLMDILATLELDARLELEES